MNATTTTAKTEIPALSEWDRFGEGKDRSYLFTLPESNPEATNAPYLEIKRHPVRGWMIATWRIPAHSSHGHVILGSYHVDRTSGEHTPDDRRATVPDPDRAKEAMVVSHAEPARFLTPAVACRFARQWYAANF
jgi:hypothetical protein